MRRLLLWAALLLAAGGREEDGQGAACGAAPAAAPTAPAGWAEVDAVLTDAIRNRTFPGCVAMVGTAREVLFAKVGTPRPGWPEIGAVSPRCSHRAASCWVLVVARRS